MRQIDLVAGRIIWHLQEHTSHLHQPKFIGTNEADQTSASCVSQPIVCDKVLTLGYKLLESFLLLG